MRATILFEDLAVTDVFECGESRFVKVTEREAECLDDGSVRRFSVNDFVISLNESRIYDGE